MTFVMPSERELPNRLRDVLAVLEPSAVGPRGCRFVGNGGEDGASGDRPGGQGVEVVSISLERELPAPGSADDEAGGFFEVAGCAQIQVVTVGGDAEQALALIRSNDLGAFFTEDAPLTTAKPISYTIRNLSDNAIASVSETTTYDLKECTPSPPTGARYRFSLTGIRAIEVKDGALQGPDYIEINSYTFYVGDVYATEQLAVDYDRPFVGLALQLGAGETHYFADHTTVNEITVDIHFNGEDQIRVRGELWDEDYGPVAIPPDQYLFDYVYKWPNAPVGTGATGVNATDGAGNTFRLLYDVTKLEDLFD